MHNHAYYTRPSVGCITYSLSLSKLCIPHSHRILCRVQYDNTFWPYPESSLQNGKDNKSTTPVSYEDWMKTKPKIGARGLRSEKFLA